MGRVLRQTIDSGAGRVIGRVAVDIAVAIWRMLAGQRCHDFDVNDRGLAA